MNRRYTAVRGRPFLLFWIAFVILALFLFSMLVACSSSTGSPGGSPGNGTPTVGSGY